MITEFLSGFSRFIKLTIHNTKTMNKIIRMFLCIAAMFLLVIQGYTQSSAWVNQVIVVNNGKLEFQPPYTDYVTVQSFSPTTHNVNVFGTIYEQTASDVVIKDNKAFVAVPDSIIEYNIDTYQRINTVPDSGVNKLYIYNSQYLLVSKKSPVSRYRLEVLDLNTLNLVGLVDGIDGDCGGITSLFDTVYVAVPGGQGSTVGKMAVIRTSDFTLVREVDFGQLGVGINDLYAYNIHVFAINSTPLGSTTGSIVVYNAVNASYLLQVYGLKIGNGYGIKGNLLYLNLVGGVGSYNLDTYQIADTTIIPDPGALYRVLILGGAVDYLNSKLYLNYGNLVANGYGLVTNLAGDSLTSFNEGIRSYYSAIDFRTPSGINDIKSSNQLIMVYPNPVQKNLEFKYMGDGIVNRILISDLTGRTVYNQETSGSIRTWNIRDIDLSPGIYILTLKTDQGNVNTKFLKQ
jgi:hypothetical protein